MRKIKLLFFTIGGIFLVSELAMAADTATINIQATVQGTCTIQSSPALMDFGNIDPSTFTDTALPGSVVFRCTQTKRTALTLQVR